MKKKNFDLRQTGSFSVSGPFLIPVTFYNVEKWNGILILRIGGRGLKNLKYPHMGVGGGQKLPESCLRN